MRSHTPIRSIRPLFALAASTLAGTTASASMLLPPTTWDGSCGNVFWHSVCGVGNGLTNWNDDNIPTLGTQVSIPMGSPNVTIVTNAAAMSLDCQSALTIQGGALEMAGSSTIHNLTIDSISLFGLQIDAGDVLLETACSWINGRMTGAGNVKNRGMMTGYPNVQGTVTFFNQSVATLKGMTIGSTAAAVNGTGSTMTLTMELPLTMISLGGTGQFTNLGTLNTVHHATSTIDIAAPFVQHSRGSLNVSGATAGGGTRFNNSATFDGGVVTVGAGSHLQFRNDGGGPIAYTFNGLPAITGSGGVELQMPFGTPWNVESELAVGMSGANGFVLQSGNVNLSARLRNQGNALWSGAVLQNGACGGCAPEFLNEGTLRINSSGVVLNTLLNNQSGAQAIQEIGNISTGSSGVLTNFGQYEHRAGAMQRVSGTTTGTFTNKPGGVYYRPASGAQDVTLSCAFVMDSGSLASFDSATTTFAGNTATGEGLVMRGADVSVHSPAVVRIATGRVEDNNQEVYGDGQFRIGGAGGNTDFLINGGAQRKFLANVGSGGGSTLVAAPSGVYLDTGAHIGGPGYLDNNKTMYLNGGTVGVGGTGRIDNYGDAFITNSFAVNGVNARFENYQYVEQKSTITMNDGTIANDWDWYVRSSATIQSFGAGVFRNIGGGHFASDPGAGQTVNVSSKFDNLAAVGVVSGTLNFTGNVLQLSGGTLSGGTWLVGPGATLDLPGTLTTIGPGAHVIYHSTSTFNDLKTLTTNNGRVQVDDFNFNSSLNNNGWMEFGGSAPVDIQGGNGNLNNGNSGGTSVLTWADIQVVPSLTDGPLPFALRCLNFNNYATVRPGGPNQPGPFKMDGNFNQQSSGVLQIELAGATPISGHDQLIVDGNVALAGTLNVRVLPGFTPTPGQQFTIIAASNGTISGTFNQITGYGQYSVGYSPSTATLTVLVAPKPGDINGDGHVNVADLLAVIIGWGTCPGTPTFCAPDLNGDGVVNVADLLNVLINWG